MRAKHVILFNLRLDIFYRHFPTLFFVTPPYAASPYRNHHHCRHHHNHTHPSYVHVSSFYPLFYPAGVWGILATAAAARGSSGSSGADAAGDLLRPSHAALAVAVFFTGHFLTRGANLQKFYFKTTSGSPKQQARKR